MRGKMINIRKRSMRTLVTPPEMIYGLMLRQYPETVRSQYLCTGMQLKATVKVLAPYEAQMKAIMK
jgi:hypothetical protein